MDVLVQIDEKIVDSLNEIVKATKVHYNNILSRALVLYIEEYNKNLRIQKQELERLSKN